MRSLAKPQRGVGNTRTPDFAFFAASRELTVGAGTKSHAIGREATKGSW